jgi:hypothetical protein
VAPTWKFCIHCGLAIDPPAVSGANTAVPTRPAISSRVLLIGGIGIFVVGIALLVIAIAFFAGAFK